MKTMRGWAVASLVVLLAACGGGGGGDDDGGGGTGPQFGTVSGQVTANGAGVQGVVVTVSGAGSATTNAAGAFQVTNVPVGSPTVAMAMPAGYITAAAGDAISKSVTVSAGQTATASFAIKRGVEVTAAGVSFAPQAITVPAGGTVRWVNGGGSHTVTPDAGAPAGAWQSAPLGAGASFEHTFAAAGTYNYHCNPHQAAGMTGTVSVGAATTNTPEPANPANPGNPYP